jgi:hypothetical protein
MKSNSTSFIDLDFLPKKLIEAFAKSYEMSFPELKLTESELIDFINRKFQLLEDSDLHNIAALITDDGIVASGYGIVRNRYTRGDQNINAGLVCDVFTNANFRAESANGGSAREDDVMADNKHRIPHGRPVVTKTNPIG